MILVIVFFSAIVLWGIIKSIVERDIFYFLANFLIGLAASFLLMLALLTMSAASVPLDDYECVEKRYPIQQLNDGYISITDKSVNYVSDNGLHTIDRAQGISIYYDTDEPYIIVRSYPKIKKDSGIWYYCGLPCTPSSYEIHLKENN